MTFVQTPSHSSGISTAAQRPARYEVPWDAPFWEFVAGTLRPGMSILDIGSGRRPIVAPNARPPGTTYVGLDISEEELHAAPEGSHDSIIAIDAQDPLPELYDRFDLIVSWLALEHVRRLDRAVGSAYLYAKPGGWFVACMSGRNAAFSIANRMIPDRVGARFVAWLRDRPLESVFPAHYDHCTERGLRAVFRSWDELHIVPLWRGAGYFDRIPLVQRLYLHYEDWAMRHGHNDLATYYVVAARKVH